MSAERHRVLIAALRTALRREDAPAVEALLHREVVVLIDRGVDAGRSVPGERCGEADRASDAGRAPARVRGAEVAALVLLALVAGSPVPEISAQSVNGQQGLVFRQGQRVTGVLCAAVSGRTLATVWVVLDPAKLRHWN